MCVFVCHEKSIYLNERVLSELSLLSKYYKWCYVIFPANMKQNSSLILFAHY